MIRVKVYLSEENLHLNKRCLERLVSTSDAIKLDAAEVVRVMRLLFGAKSCTQLEFIPDGCNE